MLGLDAAGKTSAYHLHIHSTKLGLMTLSAILYKLKLNQSVTTIPTGAFPTHSLLLSNSKKSLCKSWLQRRDIKLQERELQRLGCGWTRQDPALVASLLQRYPGLGIRRRQPGP